MLLLCCAVAACMPQPQQVASAPPPTPAPAPPPPQPLPFPQAVLSAANGVFSSVQLAPGAAVPQVTVIDPLVNGVTGEQTRATQQIQAQITELVRDRYPPFVIEPFSAATVSQLPLVLIGTFTPTGTAVVPAGPKDAYRFCLILANLRTGKVAAKKVAFARASDVDAAPTRFFADSPAWSPDPHIQAYIDACQKSKVGDAINPVYLDGIVASAQVNQATVAYDAGRYRDALDLYQTAVVSPAGDQLRIYNGIYLSSERLGDRTQAERAFGNLVDYGLRHNRLGVKLLFQSGSAGFVTNSQVSGQYDMWLREIADRAAKGTACLVVTGNTSATGLPALNDRLSLARAEFVDRRLVEDAPSLAGRITTKGVGSRNNLIGTGRDDATDALDRRVEFAVAPAC